MLDFEKTIISQYDTSSTIVQLIANMNEYVDPRSDFDAFYSFVWNVETAQGFGLDIWGRIVNIGRELKISDAENYFGFGEATGSAHPFDESPFYSGIPPQTQVYFLQDDAYRRLILLKALSNISTTTAPATNQLLQNFFTDRGRAYVNDTGGMTLRYTFEFLLTPYEFAIMTQSGALPRPAGVRVSILNVDGPTFGFSEAVGSQPFGQAPFIQEGALYVAN